MQMGGGIFHSFAVLVFTIYYIGIYVYMHTMVVDLKSGLAALHRKLPGEWVRLHNSADLFNISSTSLFAS